MLPILLACLKSNLEGGGGGGPFVITGVNLSINQNGTSACADPLKFNVSLAYTGSISGITLKLEKSWNGGAWETVGTGMLPTDFPHVENAEGMYNKYGVAATMECRVTDEADALNTATSDPYPTTYTLCL